MLLTPLRAAAAAAALGFSAAATDAPTKRDAAWVPSDPQAFQIDLGFDRVGRYVTPMGMGKPYAKAGNFTFLFSTSSPFAAVAATGCTTCAAQLDQTQMLYDISQSSTASRQGTNQTFNIGTGSMFGPVIRETCALTKSDGSKWMFDNQSIVMAQNTQGVFGNGTSGFLGLGRSSGNDSYISGILRSRGWNKVMLGLALNPYNSTANPTSLQPAGSLTVKELNQDLFTGGISWQPIARVADVPSNMPTDWALKFDSYQISVGSQSTFSLGGVAVIDPYFPEIRIPSAEATDFFSKVPNVKMTNDSSTLSWVVPCDLDLALAFTIGNNTYRVKKEQLISSDSTGTVCASLLKAWADPRVRAYLFGSPFAASAYIAYSALQDPSSDQIGVAPRADAPPTTAHQGVSARTVIVSVVASLLSVMIAAALVFLFIRWRRQRRSDPRRKTKVKKKKYAIEPFTVDAPPHSATPLISVDGGEGSWVVEQGPIGGEPSAPMRERWSAQNTPSPRMLDRKSPMNVPPPRLNLVRHSHFTSPSGFTSPIPSPRPDLDPSMSTSLHPPQVELQLYSTPDIPEEVAPPPYERDVVS